MVFQLENFKQTTKEASSLANKQVSSRDTEIEIVPQGCPRPGSTVYHTKCDKKKV